MRLPYVRHAPAADRNLIVPLQKNCSVLDPLYIFEVHNDALGTGHKKSIGAEDRLHCRLAGSEIPGLPALQMKDDLVIIILRKNNIMKDL